MRLSLYFHLFPHLSLGLTFAYLRIYCRSLSVSRTLFKGGMLWRLAAFFSKVAKSTLSAARASVELLRLLRLLAEAALGLGGVKRALWRPRPLLRGGYQLAATHVAEGTARREEKGDANFHPLNLPLLLARSLARLPRRLLRVVHSSNPGLRGRRIEWRGLERRGNVMDEAFSLSSPRRRTRGRRRKRFTPRYARRALESLSHSLFVVFAAFSSVASL